MGQRIHHTVDDRDYLITVYSDHVAIAAENAAARRTCIPGWESIPQVCRSQREALTVALTELWSWTTCEPQDALTPALAAAVEAVRS